MTVSARETVMTKWKTYAALYTKPDIYTINLLSQNPLLSTVVGWSWGQMGQLVAVIDVAVKAGIAVLALLSQPSWPSTVSSTKGLEKKRHVSSIQRSIQINASRPQSVISPERFLTIIMQIHPSALCWAGSSAVSDGANTVNCWVSDANCQTFDPIPLKSKK